MSSWERRGFCTGQEADLGVADESHTEQLIASKAWKIYVLGLGKDMFYLLNASPLAQGT